MKIVNHFSLAAIYFVLLLLCASCEKAGTIVDKFEHRTYSIENNTSLNLDIRFYHGVPYRYDSQTSAILESGESYTRMYRVEDIDDLKFSFIWLASNSDSVVIIFNSSKIFSCTYNYNLNTYSSPVDRNLFKHSNYEDLGNGKYLFKITQEDYENAEDCGGNCE